MLKLTHLFLSLAIVALLSCCSSITYQQDHYLTAFQHGDFEQANLTLDHTFQKEMPATNYRTSKEAVWLFLDRATTHFASGCIDEAIINYDKAIDALDYYNQKYTHESIQALLIRDDCEAYHGEDYEQLLARLYFAFALIHKGDTSNAYAMLRQAEEFQQARQRIYGSHRLTKDYVVPENAFCKFLFALLLEKRGDVSNASILYRQIDIPFEEALKEKATVLVVCHNGNVPYKVSVPSTASIASAFAIEMILAAHHVQPAMSSMPGIQIPMLVQDDTAMPVPFSACLDGCHSPLNTLYDVAAAAQRELDQKMPLIAARAVARAVIRRGSVAYAQKQDPCLGMIFDIAMTVANLQTKADTRSWGSLPNRLDAARFDVDAGCHSLNIQSPCSGTLPQAYKLNLKSNDLCVIHIFYLHPGVSTILIPKRFLSE